MPDRSQFPLANKYIASSAELGIRFLTVMPQGDFGLQRFELICLVRPRVVSHFLASPLEGAVHLLLGEIHLGGFVFLSFC